MNGKPWVLYWPAVVRAVAHNGVIRAPEEMQVPIDAVAGASMGALVGLGFEKTGRNLVV